MIFQQINPGTSVIPHFYVILTGQSISCIVFMTQGPCQDQKSISRSNKQKYHFKEIKLGTCVIPLSHGILSEKSIYGILLLIQGYVVVFVH